MSENTRSVIFLLAGITAAMIMLLSSCSVVHRAEKQYNSNPRMAELLENYYITRENPENNGKNEQDSIKQLIRKEIKK